MSSEIKDKYNVSINDKGYILKGAPNRPAYIRGVVASQIDRLAISDLAYSDFAGTGLFFVAQSEWAKGVKNEKKWRDDGKYYYSENIDAFSDDGEIKIVSGLSLENDFDEQLHCGYYGDLAGISYLFAGTNTGTPRKVYRKSGTWSNITGTNIGADVDYVQQIISHKQNIYILTQNTGANNINCVMSTADASTYTQHKDAIATAMSWTNIFEGTCALEIDNTLYIALYDGSATPWGCGVVKTVDNGANWVKVFENAGYRKIISMVNYGGDLYYLTNENNSSFQLRIYDISADTDTLVQEIQSENMNLSMVEYYSGNYMHLLSDKIVITVPSTDIFEYNITSGEFSRIYQIRDSLSTTEVDFRFGGIKNNNKIWWPNLIYDGNSFYHNKMDQTVTADAVPAIPKMAAGTTLYWNSTDDKSKLYYDNNYKSGIDKNYLIFNEMSPVVSIDKLFHSFSVVFDPLIASQNIKVQYSIDNQVTWNTIGTRSYSATDSSTKKEWIIPGSVIFTKIWFKIFLNGGGSNTPVVKDVIMAYKPMPDYKNQWDMRLNFSDNFKLLNNQNEQRSGNDLLGELWNQKVAKQKVPFKDIDYVECSLISGMTATATSALVDNTSRLPRQGRIRAVSGSVAEEMTYTSATPNKLLGIARGKRGTAARAYSATQTLKNDYDVYIENIKSEIGFIDENKTESVAQVMLIES